MAVFGVQMYNTKEATKYFFDTKERASNTDMLKNPFRASYKLLPVNEAEFMVVADMQPVYPNIIWVSPLILGGVLFTGISPAFALIAVPFIFGGFLHTSHAMFLGFRTGARKAGYKGKMKLVKKDDIIRRLMQNGTD